MDTRLQEGRERSGRDTRELFIELLFHALHVE